MSNRLTGLGPISEWRDELDGMLANAKIAVVSGDSEGRLSAQRAFRAFIKASPPKCDFLDDIATKAATDVFISQVDASLAALSARNDELRALTAAMSGVAVEAKKDARTIMFEDTVQALTKTKLLLESLRALEEGLDSPDQGLVGKIGTVAEAVSRLVSDLEGNGD